MATVKYIGPSAAVEIADTGQFVKRGESVTVPDQLAGRAPKGKPESDKYDPGEGLLAQTGNWVRPTAKTTKPRKSRKTTKAAPQATTADKESTTDV